MLQIMKYMPLNSECFLCTLFRANQSNYYESPHREFICSQPGDRGMTKCSEIPASYTNSEDEPCNSSSYTDEDCINWNQFYTACRPVGNNLYGGSISFDNIGYAWVTIFQVKQTKLTSLFGIIILIGLQRNLQKILIK